MGARVLRLSDHFRSVRLRELERDLLRRGNAAQRDLVRSALIVRDVEVDARIRAGLRDRRALEVAALVGRRRDGHTLARSNGDRTVVDRTVDRLCLHFKAFGLVRVIGPGIVRVGVIRIGLIGVGFGARLRIVGIRIIRVGVVGVGIRVRVRLIGIWVARVRLTGVGVVRVGIDRPLLLLHRQSSGHDLDVEVRIGDRRINLVLARRRALVGVAGVLDLRARSVNRTLQGRGERRVRLPLEAFSIVDLHLELCRSNLELADGGTDIAMGS